MPASAARGAGTQENGVMAIDLEPTLLRGHVHGHEGNGDIDIEQHAAVLAVNMVVPFYPAVVAAGLVREGQFLNQPMFREQVKRAVDRAVPNVWIAAANTLENLASGEMRLRLAHNFQYRGALGCVLEPLTWHDSTSRKQR